MNEQLVHTVAEMYRLAESYKNDLDKFNLHSIEKIFSFVKNVPYVSDIVSSGHDEFLRRPGYAIGGGDCDDKSILAGAALSSIGVPYRFVTTSYDRDGEMRHVYLEVFTKGAWLPFDATYSTNKIFRQKPYTKIIRWDNPMLTLKNNVAVLEGVGDLSIPNQGEWEKVFQGLGEKAIGEKFDLKKVVAGSAPAIGAAIGTIVPGIGTAIGATVGALLGAVLALIGVKGSTQHMEPDTAAKYADDIAKTYQALYNQLPADGKTFLLARAKDFYDRMQRDFGDWWASQDCGGWSDKYGACGTVGFLKRLGLSAQDNGYFNTDENKIYHYFFIPTYAVLRAADLETVNSNFRTWVQQKLIDNVIEPTKSYVFTKFNQIVTANEQGGIVVDDKKESPTLLKGDVGPLIGLAIGLALVFALLKQKKR